MRELVVTGVHASGTVRLADGTEYDITPYVIEVDSPEHRDEVCEQIAELVNG